MACCEELIRLIAPRLERLPSEDERIEREDSWMTIEDIRRFLQEEHQLAVTDAEIEECLLEHEENAEPRLLRSATYPHTRYLVEL